MQIPPVWAFFCLLPFVGAVFEAESAIDRGVPPPVPKLGPSRSYPPKEASNGRYSPPLLEQQRKLGASQSFRILSRRREESNQVREGTWAALSRSFWEIDVAVPPTGRKRGWFARGGGKGEKVPEEHLERQLVSLPGQVRGAMKLDLKRPLWYRPRRAKDRINIVHSNSEYPSRQHLEDLKRNASEIIGTCEGLTDSLNATLGEWKVAEGELAKIVGAAQSILQIVDLVNECKTGRTCVKQFSELRKKSGQLETEWEGLKRNGIDGLAVEGSQQIGLLEERLGEAVGDCQRALGEVLFWDLGGRGGSGETRLG